MAFLGHLGPLHPLQPAIRNAPSMGPLFPFWAKSNEAKRSQQPTLKARWVPNHQWAHLSQFCPQSHQSQKWPKGPQDSNWPRTTFWQSFNPLPLATTRGHQLKPRKLPPPLRGKTLLHQMYSIPRIQEWCTYGIIYHYEPILLRNPMVMLSGPKYAIPIQFPKYITHVDGSHFSHSVLQSLVANRRPFEDPNHLALQELDCLFFSGLFQ
ncbi:hypothetical protein O181_013896 [Austropuccinia psidii MF-1]|uniref:Uncharacterized protein n=1 Tax=Austropuccinia psidii MF-1 TaxID=1389203 RepID=A0A9Q3BX84_9BASI|nr:hypothetical protein [Austropuccinia psidii MF-1]